MSKTPPEPQTSDKFLLVSVAGVLGAALFFTGWIYRWAYFAYFQLEITTLNFPTESFFIVPIQVFFGTSSAIARTLISLPVFLGAIYLGSWLVQWAKQWLSDRALAILGKRWRSLLLKPNLFLAIEPLLGEILLFLLAIALLFQFAQAQGIADARRDAHNATSTLPAIALLTQADGILGVPLNQPGEDPPLNYRLFGDRSLVERIYRREDNDTSIPNQPRVWRLLLEQNGWIYLAIALPGAPERNNRDLRPLVVAIQETASDERVLLLGPSPSTSDN